MEEKPRLISFEKKLQQGFADGEVEIEGPIHELEMFHAAIKQALQFLEEFRQRRLPDWNVEGRKAELAGERAASRCLDINDPMGNVPLAIKLVRQSQLAELRQGRMN